MRKIWGGAFVGVNGKLVTHGGLGWRASGRRTLAQMPAPKSLCGITNGRISERSGAGLGKKMSKPEHKRVKSRIVVPNKRGTKHERFMFQCMFDDRPLGNL